MRYRTDFTIYSRHGSPVLLVEVKAKRGASASWAAELRRNMLAHDQLPSVPYFLIVVPDRLFLWTTSGRPSLPPTYSVASEPVLDPYLQRMRLDPAALSEWGLELVASSWLADLTEGRAEHNGAETRWLIDSGLVGAVRGGRVESHVPA